ncbi:MAG: winged helix-turn-helix domain-containing protein [Desulfurococcales archaeon]|nr:winged helix-turn-helix domain-containing protein [Desulfurococcales archaeon]
MKRGLITTLIVFTMLSLLLGSSYNVHASQASPTVTYTYDCRNGVVYVIADAEVSQGSTNITLPEDPGTLEDSITAIDQNGTPLPVLAGGGKITVFLSNTTTRIQVSYVITPSQVSNTYMIEIHPGGTATVILPVNGSLVYASDSPSIYANYTRITLVYKTPGIYTVYYNVPTVGEAGGTTTTPPGQTTTSQTQATSTTTTSQSPAQTTTTQTAPPQTTTTTGSSSTTPVTKTTPNQESSTTSTTTLASPKTSPSKGGSNLYYAILVAILVIIGLAYYLYKNKTPREPGPAEPRLIDSQLDDRDLLLLKLISRGGHNISSLARESGLSKSVVWRRIKKLEDLGLIETSKGIGKVDLSLTDKGRRVLEET